MNMEELEDGSKAQVKAVKKLHKTIRWCDAFRHADKMSKDYLNTIPLIQLLASPFMRPRHWEMVKTAVGKEFTPPYESKELTLGNIIDLQLHEFAADIEDICDQATKEGKMEINIAQLGERWLGIEWLMDPYKDTDVPLLKMGEEDFEALEADQLAVQGMLANRFVKQFIDEVTDWQN
jgi:dynein heavy chain